MVSQIFSQHLVEVQCTQPTNEKLRCAIYAYTVRIPFILRAMKTMKNNKDFLDIPLVSPHGLD